MKQLGIITAIVVVLATTVYAAPTHPYHVSYQGFLEIGGAPAQGNFRFGFALVDTTTNTTFWSNDGNAVPSVNVELSVENGIFTTLLGAPPMQTLDPTLLQNFNRGHVLRIWYTDGNIEPILLGDHILSASVFAMRAFYADFAPGSFSANGIIETGFGFKFPDGTLQTTAATGGTNGGNTLDAAYDQGGSGLGRTITADTGPVTISGADGLIVTDDIDIGRNMTNGWLALNNVGSVDTAKLLSFGESTTPSFFWESGFSGVGDTGTLMRFKSAWTAANEPIFSLRGDGRVGMGVDNPFAPLHLGGGQWNVDTTYGDLLIGNSTYGLKVGVAVDGISAGDVRLRSFGGTARIGLGGGANDVMWIRETGVEITQGPFQVASDGQVNLSGDFGNGTNEAAIFVNNTNPLGASLWVESNSFAPAMVLNQDGSGLMFGGYHLGTLVFKVDNQGNVVTPSISITGGADLSEPFTIAKALGEIEPGSIMIIDPENPGSLTISNQPYDTRVAGIVSGAGGVNPGLTLSQQGLLEGGQQVALSGRVYVRSSSENGPIRPGDMLTTSTLPGIAMRATDRDKSFGAVVGKAMTGLDESEGLVLMLVGLQ